MKIGIIGLGSMGRRRIRCLKKINISEIYGFDINPKRYKKIQKQEKIILMKRISDIKKLDAVIISTSPDKHNIILKQAIKYSIPAFVEASVILNGLEKLNNEAKKNKILIAPSCTLLFHPAIEKIKLIIEESRFGKITNFNYHIGQYLPDWHPWEDIRDYYVSKPKTSGSREMVTFELTWIFNLFGLPKKILSKKQRTLNLGINIYDSYAMILSWNNYLGNILVDVVSRFATRTLTINFENSQLKWNWINNYIEYYDIINKRWIKIRFLKGRSKKGYNKNIIEEMYVKEMKYFLKALLNEDDFPNTLDKDIEILKILNKIEKSG